MAWLSLGNRCLKNYSHALLAVRIRLGSQLIKSWKLKNPQRLKDQSEIYLNLEKIREINAVIIRKEDLQIY